MVRIVWDKMERKYPKVSSIKNYQTGKLPDLRNDATRKALPPGWRISKNGKPYYEARRNRSDKLGSNL